MSGSNGMFGDAHGAGFGLNNHVGAGYSQTFGMGGGMGSMPGMDGGMMGNYPSAYGGQMGHQRMGSGYPAARGTLNTPFGGGTGMGDYGGMMGNQALAGSNGMAFGQQLGH